MKAISTRQFRDPATAPIIASLDIESGRAEGSYQVRMLSEPGISWATPEKVQELWLEARQHDVLFSDYTRGKAKPFLRVLAAPNSTWFEVMHLQADKPVGLFYLSKIIPGYDAQGHFTFWDSVGRGREPLVLDTLRYFFDRYDLQRVSADVPVYQRGTMRFVERLGFTLEGERRNGVIYKGDWWNQKLYGILREELIDV